MLFVALVIGADHATLEDAEEVLGGVRCLPIRADILATTAPTMGDGLVHGKLLAGYLVELAFVGMQFLGARNIGNENFADALGGRLADMNRTGFAVRLNKSHDLLLMRMALLVTLRAL